ncbi:hypothetical protein MUCCIDRAFT_108448 [Mucor lusitanicus CBS 277.49]|uniref:Uncharacterized protein n=1 Tax=Mucor lusitanicus CBS 277.49 TaxID=747725 RepID=A0A168MA63_MUCCL|nr:hypothetical protein MUCCIDRAFT_108448 [Mucor lusitanicus CBS 277.49]
MRKDRWKVIWRCLSTKTPTCKIPTGTLYAWNPSQQLAPRAERQPPETPMMATRKQHIAQASASSSRIGKDYLFSLTVNMVNTAVMSHQDRKQREKKDIGSKKKSTSPYYKQLAAGTNNSVVPVDQYKSTVTCSSYFHRTSKQAHLRDGHIKRISGAMVCYNIKCPRRLTSGFSSLAAQDDLALPPFRRSRNTNK